MVGCVRSQKGQTALQRKIIHIDMDAFYASVEQRDRPELRGRPVVVAWRGARSVVCAASYEARRSGVRSAMPALRAEKLCPDAVFVPPDFSRYREASQTIRQVFLSHTPLVEPLSLDEAYLDVSQAAQANGAGTALARRIRAQIFDATGLTASAGIAPNRFLAKIASDYRKPNGQCTIHPERVEAFLLHLPVGRIPGVGRVTQQRLAGMGIDTVGQLRTVSLAVLQQRFGRFGEKMYERARGIDDRPVSPDRLRKSLSCEDTFSRDLLLSELLPELESLCRKLWNMRDRLSGKPRTIVLKLKTSDFRILTRSLTPPCFPASCDAFEHSIRELLRRVDLPHDTRYRLAGVGFENIVYAGSQPSGQAEQMGLF